MTGMVRVEVDPVVRKVEVSSAPLMLSTAGNSVTSALSVMMTL